MIKPTSLNEQILFSTVRIESILHNGTISTGTGFFFKFNFEPEITCLITNKHVVEGAVTGKFQLHESTIIDGQTQPSGNFFTLELDRFMSRWIPHPDDNIDLCAMLLQPLSSEARRLNKIIFNIVLDDKLIFDDIALSKFNAVEEILMVGYPIGLWDDANNLPLIRRGITATYAFIDFKGKSIGVIDMACFPGSSGSPVLILNEGTYGTKSGTMIGSSRAVLLGILYAGPCMIAEGEIVTKMIPTSNQPISYTQFPIHLGYIVKAKEILVLGKRIHEVLRRRGENIGGATSAAF